MSDGRTIWRPKDTAWWRREYVVALGEEFGPVGPAALDWLSDEAKIQNDGGRVKSGPRTLARGIFTDPVTVCHVLSRAVQLGALHDYEEREGRFTCRISGWGTDNDRGGAALRQARSRAKSEATVTACHGESRSVTRKERREEASEANASDPEEPSNDSRLLSLVTASPSTETVGQQNARRLCELLAELMVGNGCKRPTVTKRWLAAARLLIDRDGRTPEQVEACIRWCQADEFWRTNILSMPKLREQYDRLRLAAQRGGSRESRGRAFHDHLDRLASGGAA